MDFVWFYSLPQPWRMVPVAFFFNTIFVIIACVHVAYVYQGFDLFCRNIHPANEKSVPERYSVSCIRVQLVILGLIIMYNLCFLIQLPGFILSNSRECKG